MAIRVILADDHRIVRQGLKAALDKVEGIEVVATARDGRETVRLVQRLEPDLVVMDVFMPDLNGIEATRQISAENTSCRVLGLSMYSDKRSIDKMLKSGASGYLLKDCSLEELVEAIRTVSRGGIYLSKEITKVVVEDLVRSDAQGAPSGARASLTQREREVLQLLAEGKSTRETADILNVSVKTVEAHRRQIMEKLKTPNLAELIKYAIREGITSLDY
jgi:DNA-binding NarL/FixJ family response regulator